MSKDYAEFEREFIAELKERTGKDLAEWMAAIAAARLCGKNAVIDWLRPQGFTFANASWLERIHHNGGRPIYAEGAAEKAAAARKALKDAGRAEPGPESGNQPQLPPLQPVPVAVPSPAPAADAALESLLAKGKAFRPLAVFLIAEIAKAVPGAAAAARDGYVSIGAPEELAVLDIRPREVRLGLALGDLPLAGGLQKARLAGAGPHITRMLVLTDARQVDAGLLALVRTARARIGGMVPPPGRPP
jgi:hypothetical protein